MNVAQFKTPPLVRTKDKQADLRVAARLLEDGMKMCEKYSKNVMDILATLTGPRGPYQFTTDWKNNNPWPRHIRSPYDQELALLPSYTSRVPHPGEGAAYTYIPKMVRNLLPTDAIREVEQDQEIVKRAVENWAYS